MPEWMLSDLQQRLNSAQQLLTEQSMLQSPLRMTWPRPASPGSARKGDQCNLYERLMCNLCVTCVSRSCSVSMREYPVLPLLYQPVQVK